MSPSLYGSKHICNEAIGGLDWLKIEVMHLLSCVEASNSSPCLPTCPPSHHHIPLGSNSQDVPFGNVVVQLGRWDGPIYHKSSIKPPLLGARNWLSSLPSCFTDISNRQNWNAYEFFHTSHYDIEKYWWYLKFQAMGPLVATVHYSLVAGWSRHGPWSAINETPALLEGCTFSMNCLGKELRVKPH